MMSKVAFKVMIIREISTELIDFGSGFGSLINHTDVDASQIGCYGARRELQLKPHGSCASF